MAISTRRDFILFAAAVSFGCEARGAKTQVPSGAALVVRPPAVGQSWRYAKHDYFTGAIVDTQIDRVSAVGQSIEIQSHSDAVRDNPLTYPSFGDSWWREYMGPDTAPARLPVEVQKPWGMVVVDPHWSELQAFEKPIPLWPSRLRSDWSSTVSTYYKIPDNNETMPWQLTMQAKGWESITVPAGHFTALHYFNMIDFRYTNVSGRVAGLRQENIWFVPEIGRWVKRESSGTFFQDVGTEFKESGYRWELLSWT